MSKVIMEFEKGGAFELIFDPAAPKTTEAFKKALPLTGECLQGRFAGEEFFFQADITAEPENLIQPKFGSIAFNSDPAWKAVCIYYGPKMKGGPYSHFAEVAGNLDELNRIGVRIWKDGREKVVIKEIQG